MFHCVVYFGVKSLGKDLDKTKTVRKALRQPLHSMIILTSEMILELPGKLVREPDWYENPPHAQMTNHVSTTDSEVAGGSFWWFNAEPFKLEPYCYLMPSWSIRNHLLVFLQL